MPQTPEQTRRILLAGQEVPYLLRRGRRKTIGLSIDQRGLRVGAPSRAGLDEIEALLRKHSTWVLQKLDAWRSHAERPAFAVQDGAQLPWLGGQLQITLASDARRVVWSHDGGRLYLPHSNPGTTLQRALRQRVRQHLGHRLGELAARLGVQTPPLTLSSARTRWGSCNSRGHVRLNWRLGFFPPAVIDYVVAHELAHLKEMNHSPRFWSVVETLCPEWRQRRAELKSLAPALATYWS